MIDTHTHLYLDEFATDRDAAVQRAKDDGVEAIMLPNVDLTTIDAMNAMHNSYPDYAIMANGLHPTSVDINYRATLDTIVQQFSTNKYKAVGEVGIDLYWDKTYINEQIIVFTEQLKLGVEMNLPVIIHCREGLKTILDVFKRFNGTLPRCIFHSFTGTSEEVAQIREYTDPYFGINGIVTFKKAQINTTLSAIGIDRILLETDSPYLAPVPFRGKRNESSYLKYICNHIAATLSLTPGEVDIITTDNAKRIFAI